LSERLQNKVYSYRRKDLSGKSKYASHRKPPIRRAPFEQRKTPKIYHPNSKPAFANYVIFFVVPI